MPQPVYTFAKWKVKEGKFQSVLTHLATVARETVQEKGNLFYTIHQSLADKNLLVLHEGYTSQEAADEHRSAPYFKDIVIGQIVPDLESREVIMASVLDLTNI